MSTYRERLAWQHDEDTGGYYADPSLEERNDQADEEFRHFDSYVFAQALALTGGWERSAKGGAAVDGELVGGTPTNVPGTTPPAQIPVPGGCAGSEVEGSSCPPMPLGLASNVERWMWTP